jgi:RNA polymerase sigma factor (sigma-70 family)
MFESRDRRIARNRDGDLCENRDPSDISGMLNLAREGDEVACALLVNAYEPGLRRTARNALGAVLRTEVDIEDLIQSVHWSLWVGLREGSFHVDSGEGLLAVARAILRRKVARVWRTLERRRRLAVRNAGKIRPDEDAQASEGAAIDPADRISADDQFEHLCKIMTRTERRLIELRMLGYSTAEAGREMGRDSENLRVTLARLRKKLRERGYLSDAPPRSRGPK